MDELIKGSKEYMPVKIADRLNGISTLDGIVINFRVTDDADVPAEIVAWTTCVNQGMIALPLVDTSLNGFAKGKYNLYVRVNVATEVPVLGPFEFMVI